MFKTSETIKTIAAALAKAQGLYPDIPKDKTVVVKGKTKAGAPYEYSYKYAELSSILKATRKPLTDNELSIAQSIAKDGDQVLCVTKLFHSSGEWYETTYPVIYSEDDMQGVAGGFTFARRYGVTALLGVAAEEDTDGNGANREKEAAKKKPDPAPKAPPAQQKPKDPPPPPAPPPAFFDKPKEPLNVMQRMELGRYVFPGGKFKGKKLGDVPSNDIMSYRNDIYVEFPDGGPNPMPLAARDIINRIEAYYADQIK